MKIQQLLGTRFRETPSDCQIASHILMLRGGYIKNVGSGIFSLFPPAKRIVQKIEQIIREEMNRIDGQEVLLPVALPASLWKESGRYDSVGSELLRFQDRGGNDMVLGMTHEEAVVHLARGSAPSYTDYPFMIYQIQTKFRDEPRARGGLIRVREFTMKDAYSFHGSQEDLEEYYKKCHEAYERIFRRCGIPEVISVQSDSGMMGGKIAHEFMLVTEVGEDYLAICGNQDCDFRSNMEISPCIVKPGETNSSSLEQIQTPGIKSIEDLCAFLKVTPEQTCKGVLYQKNSDDTFVMVFLRGDLEVNEIKLRNFLATEVRPAIDPPEGLIPGFFGPLALSFPEGMALYDQSLREEPWLVAGANVEDVHISGLCPSRDLPGIQFTDLAKVREHDLCPCCGRPELQMQRGIEVGNIFQLGTKYTDSMGMRYLDPNGTPQTPIMGCYGIGVGRLMASVCEQRRDEFGPIWPISIAPWTVQICALRVQDQEVANAANALYSGLTAAGVEVLFDDRAVSPGVMFNDADLLGVPLRVIVSPKTLARNAVELTTRDKKWKKDVDLFDAKRDICAEIELMKQEFLN